METERGGGDEAGRGHSSQQVPSEGLDSQQRSPAEWLCLLLKGISETPGGFQRYKRNVRIKSKVGSSTVKRWHHRRWSTKALWKSHVFTGFQSLCRLWGQAVSKEGLLHCQPPPGRWGPLAGCSRLLKRGGSEIATGWAEKQAGASQRLPPLLCPFLVGLPQCLKLGCLRSALSFPQSLGGPPPHPTGCQARVSRGSPPRTSGQHPQRCAWPLSAGSPGSPSSPHPSGPGSQ